MTSDVVLAVAIKVLSQRVLALITLLMTFALFCWAMYLGDWLRFAVAGAFGVAIFLPVLIKGDRRGNEET